MNPVGDRCYPNILAWIATGLLALCLSISAHAVLLTGPFLESQNSAAGIGTNGADFTINGLIYPVPTELLPTASFTRKLSPEGDYLIARSAASTSQCSGSTISFYLINPASRSLSLEQGPTCVSEGIAFDRFFERSANSTQIIAAIGEVGPVTAIQQRICWVALGAQPASVWAGYDRIIESVRFGPSGTVALVKHAVSTSPAGPLATYSVVDLCPGTLGTRLARLPGLSSQASARVMNSGPNYIARVFDPNLAGGSTDIALSDCVGGSAPPNSSPVNIEVSGPGRVTSGNQINCPGTCSALINQSANIALQAIPAPGASFVGWSGACTTTDLNIVVPVGSGLDCTASFDGPTSAISLEAAVLPGELLAGLPLTVAVTLTNDGPDDSGRVDFILTLPLGDELIDGTVPCSYSVPSGRGCVLLAGVAANQSETFEFDITPDPLWRGAFPISIKAVLNSNVFDPSDGDNDALLAPIVNSVVDVSVAIQTDTGSEAPGEPINAVVDIINNGPSAATGIQIDVVLPQEWVRTDSQTERAFSCIAPTLYPGNNWKLHLAGEIAATANPGTNANLTVSYSGAEAELDTSNDSDTAMVQITATPTQAAADSFALMLDDVLFLGLNGEPYQLGETTSYHSADFTANRNGHLIYTGENVLNLVDSFTRTPGGNDRFTGGPQSARGVNAQGVTTVFAHSVNDQGDGAAGASYQTGTCGIKRFFTAADQTAVPNSDLQGLSLPIFRQEGTAYRPSGPNATGQFRAGLQIFDGSDFINLIEPTTPVPGSVGVGELNVTGFHWNGSSVALHAGIVDGGSLNKGIYFHDLTALNKVIDNTDLLPDRPVTLLDFRRISSSNNQASIFIRGVDGRWGLYRYNHVTTSLQLLLDDTTVLPGTQGQSTTIRNLTSVNDESGPAMDGQDIAIAVNTEESATTGKTLYLLKDGAFRRILGPGDALAGRTVADVSISSYAMDSDRIAGTVKFTNLTAAVFVYTIGAVTDAKTIFTSGFE